MRSYKQKVKDSLVTIRDALKIDKDIVIRNIKAEADKLYRQATNNNIEAIIDKIYDLCEKARELDRKGILSRKEQMDLCLYISDKAEKLESKVRGYSTAWIDKAIDEDKSPEKQKLKNNILKKYLNGEIEYERAWYELYKEYVADTEQEAKNMIKSVEKEKRRLLSSAITITINKMEDLLAKYKKNLNKRVWQEFWKLEKEAQNLANKSYEFKDLTNGLWDKVHKIEADIKAQEYYWDKSGEFERKEQISIDRIGDQYKTGKISREVATNKLVRLGFVRYGKGITELFEEWDKVKRV